MLSVECRRRTECQALKLIWDHPVCALMHTYKCSRYRYSHWVARLRCIHCATLRVFWRRPTLDSMHQLAWHCPSKSLCRFSLQWLSWEASPVQELSLEGLIIHKASRIKKLSFGTSVVLQERDHTQITQSQSAGASCKVGYYIIQTCEKRFHFALDISFIYLWASCMPTSTRPKIVS